MKTVIRDIFLKQTLNIQKIFIICIVFTILPERLKIEKCTKLVRNVYDKKNYVVHIKALRQALNHGLILKEVRKVIQFNQKTWLKPYIDMNTKLRTDAKMTLKKISLN